MYRQNYVHLGAFCVLETLKVIERALQLMSDKNQRREKAVPETPEELVSLAQEYFSNEFPNSGRGCPSPIEIGKQIESGQLPDDALRKHLLACSSCFVRYRERLQTSRDRQSVVALLRRRISELGHYPWLRILVPSLPVILIAVIAVIYFRPRNTQDKVTSVNQPVEVVDANANSVTTASPEPLRIDSANNIERATHVARVDLNDYSLQRGNETGEEPRALQIERTPTAFTIRLPEGSPPGTYSVSILDAFGKSIKTRTSHSADGKRLTATLNLASLKNQKYRLCVSRADEPPNCYPVVITSRGK
jgi:hypothetical protein